MLSALFSFLGGSVFRMLWGEISAWIKARQDHAHEIELARLQMDLAAKQHALNIEAWKVQAEMGVKVIAAQADADTAREEAHAWREAIARAAAPSGIAIVDAWNASVRPAFATVVLALWVLALQEQGWRPGEWDLQMMGAVAGFFFADRSLRRVGK